MADDVERRLRALLDIMQKGGDAICPDPARAVLHDIERCKTNRPARVEEGQEARRAGLRRITRSSQRADIVKIVPGRRAALRCLQRIQRLEDFVLRGGRFQGARVVRSKGWLQQPRKFPCLGL